LFVKGGWLVVGAEAVVGGGVEAAEAAVILCTLGRSSLRRALPDDRRLLRSLSHIITAFA
jgi:hypothetical protein